MVWFTEYNRMSTLEYVKLRGKPTGWAIDNANIWMHKSLKSKELYLEIDNKVIGYLLLRKLSRNLYTPKMVELDPKVKGSGLILALYHWCIIEKGWAIKAGDVTNCQTVGGRFIWNELAKDPDLTVRACEDGDSTDFVICYPDDKTRTLYAREFEIYETDAELFVTAAEV